MRANRAKFRERLSELISRSSGELGTVFTLPQ